MAIPSGTGVTDKPGCRAAGATTDANGSPCNFSRVASQTEAPARSGNHSLNDASASRQKVAGSVVAPFPIFVPIPSLLAGTPYACTNSLVVDLMVSTRCASSYP
jgi:hypothetical protein